MAEYIEREKLIEHLKKDPLFDLVERYGITDVIESIPAADVWEVVHCADCVHAEESLVSGCVYCNEMERARIKEGFCAWGERKANDG